MWRQHSFFLYELLFFCTSSCHVLSTGSMWESEFIALFLLWQNLLEIITSKLHIDIFCAVLPYHSIDSRVNAKFYPWLQRSSNLGLHWPNTSHQGLVQLGSWKLQGNWRQTVFLTITKTSDDCLVHFRFCNSLCHCKGTCGPVALCVSHSETAKFLAGLQGGISFQDRLRSSYTPQSVSLCHPMCIPSRYALSKISFVPG